MILSIIIPAFNEEKTIATILQLVDTVRLKNVKKEIIVVNDGSTDATATIIKKFVPKTATYKVVHHEGNYGKGVAVKSGLQIAEGEYAVIQDADLEYHPSDLQKLLAFILSGEATIVYGTRLKRMPDFTRDERTGRFFVHYLGNKFLSLVTSILYGQWLTDMETGYKIFPVSLLSDMSIHARGFEFEPELTAKILKKGGKIVEVPITTNPRGYAEGKKLNTIRDGIRALWTLIKYRFTD